MTQLCDVDNTMRYDAKTKNELRNEGLGLSHLLHT